MPRARRDPRLARRPRRADPHALDGRGLRDQQPHRARAPRGQLARARSAGSRCCAMPARSSSAPSPARAWATTAPGPNHVLPTCGHRALLVAARRLRLPEAQQPDRGQRGRRRRCWARSRPSWPTAKGCRRTQRAAELRLAARRRGTSTAAKTASSRSIACRPAPPSTADRIAAVIRQDVQSMHGYAIQPSAGLVKLDAMENPFRLPPDAAARTGRAARPGRDQPLSGGLRRPT